MPKAKAPKMKVADQKKITVYYPPVELADYHTFLDSFNKAHQIDVSHGLALKLLGDMLKSSPTLQEHLATAYHAHQVKTYRRGMALQP